MEGEGCLLHIFTENLLRNINHVLQWASENNTSFSVEKRFYFTREVTKSRDGNKTNHNASEVCGRCGSDDVG